MGQQVVAQLVERTADSSEPGPGVARDNFAHHGGGLALAPSTRSASPVRLASSTKRHAEAAVEDPVHLLLTTHPGAEFREHLRLRPGGSLQQGTDDRRQHAGQVADDPSAGDVGTACNPSPSAARRASTAGV